MAKLLTGLIAATHTPFHRDGSLNLKIVEKQAEHLLKTNVKTVFICGSTGESQSLTIEERLALAQRWSDVIRGSEMKLVIHVGANCLSDAKFLAAQAPSVGAIAISAISPSYFKPKSIATLIDCCLDLASAAPGLPFYFYDIPSLTGINLPMPDFLEAAADAIPSLAGLKFSNPDLMAFQKCLRCRDWRFEVPFGIDECLLAALALGATGAVGSSYNFGAQIYHRLWRHFEEKNFESARVEQYRSVQLIDTLANYGYMGASKALMGFLGIDVGHARLPNTNLNDVQTYELRVKLEQLGYFDWIN